MSLARDDDPVIVVNGFSKAWAMTGWRIGWVVAPSRHAETWAILSECFNTGATVFVQQAAMRRWSGARRTVARLRDSVRDGRDIVSEVLGRCARIELTPPSGAFYAFRAWRGLASSLAFAEGCLRRRTSVSRRATPSACNEEYFRLCFAHSHAGSAKGWSASSATSSATTTSSIRSDSEREGRPGVRPGRPSAWRLAAPTAA